ncbi:hypothetical protein GTA08_BOTSDO03413 [Botryosphaeria dothidea]|uniref:Uncharacterized protein n=1 Tax=Botryosphaeria dothidea TaxID=55169 RepID=A0A8H4IVT4_9PEZI|nr:hypothetical protein GTA08_BOTSDO03413 [Botryosphaeria dothidea]
MMKVTTTTTITVTVIRTPRKKKKKKKNDSKDRGTAAVTKWIPPTKPTKREEKNPTESGNKDNPHAKTVHFKQPDASPHPRAERSEPQRERASHYRHTTERITIKSSRAHWR